MHGKLSSNKIIIIILQIYFFDTTDNGFGSDSRTVMQVLAINLTSGWQDFRPFSEEVFEKVTLKFLLLSNLFFEPLSYAEALLYPDCSIQGCPYSGEIPITLSSTEKRDYLGIHWVLHHVIEELSMSVILRDGNASHVINGSLFMEFKKKGKLDCL